MSEITLPAPQEKTFLERFLSLFSVFNGGEGGTAILLVGL